MKYTGKQFYTVSVRTFIIPFYSSGSDSAKAKSYGSYGSGSATQKNKAIYEDLNYLNFLRLIRILSRRNQISF